MCDAAADCQASAKAEANASLECTPPQLRIDYELNAVANLTARAEFAARLSELKVRGVAIVQGAAKYEALINGRVNGQVVFNPAPLVVVPTELEGVLEAGAEGDLFADIPPGRIGCVIPALTASVGMLEDMGTSATANLSAQGRFATAITGGFSS
jgi:hypothetical protein